MAVLPWYDDAGVLTATARLEIDYDNVDLRVRTVRVVNPAPRGLVITAARTNGTRTYTATAPASQTTTQSIPTTVANRLQLVVDARGRLDGVEYSTAWAAA